MAILGYTGKLSVAVGVVWKGDMIPNTISAAEQKGIYALANESLTELKLTALVGGASRVLERKATQAKRLFDASLNFFVMEAVASSVVEDFLSLSLGDKVSLEGVFTFSSFFDVLLQQVTRNDADLHNLANPNDSQPILDTFTHSAAGGKVSISYKSSTKKFDSLEAVLADKKVLPPKKGKIPAVQLVVAIDLAAGGTPAHADLMRQFIAMDWSKLARFGVPDSKRTDVQIWNRNVRRYLLNHVDITRGERFRQGIIGRHQGKSPKQLATDLRDDLDLHLITANHWGQAREDMKTEKHQRLLSDLFGTLHQKTFLSSPVHFQRWLTADFFSGDTDKIAALAFQFGTGHCGEHASCSFSTLRAIMQLPGNSVKSAIQSGNANIDHAFVVYNLALDEVINTLTENPRSNRPVGTEQQVFNLRDAIAKNPPGTGFVLDPYLDKSVMKPSADELLTALNRPDRVKSGKATDFLYFGDYYPPPTPPVTDLTSASSAQRKARVKNV